MNERTNERTNEREQRGTTWSHTEEQKKQKFLKNYRGTALRWSIVARPPARPTDGATDFPCPFIETLPLRSSAVVNFALDVPLAPPPPLPSKSFGRREILKFELRRSFLEEKSSFPAILPTPLRSVSLPVCACPRMMGWFAAANNLVVLAAAAAAAAAAVVMLAQVKGDEASILFLFQ